jgi:hypothetical protein
VALHENDWDTPDFQIRSPEDILGAYTVAWLESIAKNAGQNEPGAYKEKEDAATHSHDWLGSQGLWKGD